VRGHCGHFFVVDFNDAHAFGWVAWSLLDHQTVRFERDH
jgi:hypothetical protein